MKKSTILEQITNNIVNEDFPPSFDKNVFYGLKSFAQRVKYCTQHLPKIAAGSGRVVFQIDEKTVLKLAKNPKGIAQNLQEAQLGTDNYFSDIVAQVYKYDQNDQWLEVERATKVTPTKFKALVGFDIETVSRYLKKREEDNAPRGKSFHMSSYEFDPVVLEQLHNNDFIKGIVELMHAFNIMSGDLTRLSSYGEVNRDGHPTIVLVDYGLSDEVYQDHYAPKQTQYVPQRW